MPCSRIAAALQGIRRCMLGTGDSNMSTERGGRYASPASEEGLRESLRPAVRLGLEENERYDRQAQT